MCIRDRPKLIFEDKGIALWSKSLTFKNMQVVLNNIGTTPYTAEWNWMTVCASKDSTLTLDNTDMTLDGTGTASNVHAIYFTGNDKLNIQNGSNLTIQNYTQDALEWDGGDGGYNVNITNGSSYTSDQDVYKRQHLGRCRAAELLHRVAGHLPLRRRARHAEHRPQHRSFTEQQGRHALAGQHLRRFQRAAADAPHLAGQRRQLLRAEPGARQGDRRMGAAQVIQRDRAFQRRAAQ